MSIFLTRNLCGHCRLGERCPAMDVVVQLSQEAGSELHIVYAYTLS